MSVITAEALGVPQIFNAAAHVVDRNVAKGRGGYVAIECGDARIRCPALGPTHRSAPATNGVSRARFRSVVQPPCRIVEELPKTATGKIQRFRLRQLVDTGPARGSAPA